MITEMHFVWCIHTTLGARVERLWTSLDKKQRGQEVDDGGARHAYGSQGASWTMMRGGWEGCREGAEEKAPAIEGST